MNVSPELNRNDETPAGASEPGVEPVRLDWTLSQPLFSDTVLTKQLALVFGVTLLILALFFVVLFWPVDLVKLWQLLKLVLIVGGILLGLLALTLLLFYGGRYEYHYILNAQGIERRPAGSTARKNTIVNFLLLFSGKPGAMGTGLLAQTRQVERIAWKKVDGVVGDAAKKTVTLYKGKKVLMVAACNEINYETVLRQAREAAADPFQTKVIP